MIPKSIKDWIKTYLYFNLDDVLPIVKYRQVEHKDVLVSVIIPCYNIWRYLEQAVDSILDQTLDNLEIIIIDASTDNETINYLKKFQKPKTKVYFIEDKGVSDARNVGISKAKGKYICCLDSDDCLEPTYLEKAVLVMETNPGISFVYSDAKLFGEEDNYWRVQDYKLEDILDYNHVTVVGVYKKEVWEKVEGYSDDMREGFEDWEYWIKAGKIGFRGKAINEPLFNYRKHGVTRDTLAFSKHYKDLIKKIFRKHFMLKLPWVIKKIKKNYYKDYDVENPFINYNNFNIKGPVKFKLIENANDLTNLNNIKNIEDFIIISKVRLSFEEVLKIYKTNPYIYNLPDYFPEDKVSQAAQCMINIRQ